MFDTVVFRQAALKKDIPQTIKDSFKKSFYANGIKWFKNPPKDSISYTPSIDILSLLYQRDDIYIDITASLPKLVYGNNVNLINTSDLDRALNMVNEFAFEHTGIQFDAYSASIRRVDFCYNWKLSNNFEVRRYLESFRLAKLPELYRCIYEGTVLFRNGSQSLYFYDKHQQMRKDTKASKKAINQSEGVLRMELSYRRKKACDNLAKANNTSNNAASLLSAAISQNELNRYIRALRIDQATQEEANHANILRAKYPENKDFRKALLFRDAIIKYGEGYLKEHFYSPSVYYNLRKLLHREGEYPIRISHEPLPPLPLINFDEEDIALSA